jgi:hypothetical protein
MPFLDHLEELRWRIIYSLAALVIGIGIGFWLTIKADLVFWLQQPVLPYLRGNTLVYTHPGDTFSVMLQMSFIAGALQERAPRCHSGAWCRHGTLRRWCGTGVLPRVADDAEVFVRLGSAIADANDHSVGILWLRDEHVPCLRRRV